MRILVTNGENPSEKVEMEVEEYSQVKDIKYKFDEEFSGNEKWTNDHYRLIWRNIILDEEDYIKRYKFCERDQICIGGIETYMSSDDVIVEVFLAGCVPEFKWLIVHRKESIETIRSMLERFQSDIIHIWNSKGKEMQNVQIVTEIDTKGYYQLIVSCDGENLSFDECCNQHDRCKIILYYYCEDWWLFDEFSEMARTKIIHQIMKIRKIISTNDAIDARLKENLSSFSSAFVRSNFLFGHNITKRIWDICNVYRKLMKSYPFSLEFCNSDEWHTMKLFFLTALLVAVRKYSDARRDFPEYTNKSFNDILIDALDHLIKHLRNPCEDWKHAAKRWINHFLLISRSEAAIDGLLDKFDPSSITLRMNGKEYDIDIELKPITILDATKAIAYKFREDPQDLYCIDHGIYDKPKDGDPYRQPWTFFELMSKMADFENLKELASGGFGSVFKCQHRQTGREVAIKKLIDVKDSLHREIVIGSLLFEKDKLFKYSLLVKDQTSIHLAMPYMPGGSLTSYIQIRKSLEEMEIIKISNQILAQIKELHQSKIIHCDIKPDNIVFDIEGNVKLIDFGLAKYTAGFKDINPSRKRKASSPGTIYYMAPELIRETPNSTKIDIWSFGMVMVEMVTGKPPFHLIGPGQILLRLGKMQKYNFKPNTKISNELKQFINLCLTVNPNERPTAQQLIECQFIINYLQISNANNNN